METESTIEDIVNTVQRQSGVGKSSLINCVFGIDEARVSHFKPGEADIEQEFVSDENKFFVLHDSKGFEPADTSNFEAVSQFVEQRSKKKELKDRLHAIWLCTKTPTAGGRVFEIGDEKLLQLAREKGVPTVIVFTQYDKLVRTKIKQLTSKKNTMTQEVAEKLGEEQASQTLQTCLRSVEATTRRLNIPFPRYAKVSVRPRYQADVMTFVKITREIVQAELKNDAWAMWSIAQRASLPVKIDACIDVGLNYYHLALSGATPGVGKLLLQECLFRVHQDIITCWNMKNGHQILKSGEFKQLMLYLVKDIQQESYSSTPPEMDRITQFVTLVTAASVPVAPAVAILGLSYFFVKWLSDAVLENIPIVECMMMAYTVDLISVLKSLSNFALMNPNLEATSWEVLKNAFEAYERTNKLEQNHRTCRLVFQQNNQSLNRDAFRAKIRELVSEI